MAWSTPDTITVKGYDLCRDLLGSVTLGDMAFLELTDRLPTPAEAKVFNAIAVSLVEHGISPSALATRLTLAGAPEAMQAAVAAGLCGLGSVFVGSIEQAARLLQDTLRDAGPDVDLEKEAARIVADFRERGETIPGVGHHFHKPIDPRTPRLFEIAAQNDFSGRFIQLMQAISAEAEAKLGRVLPINATGAIAAVGSELGIGWDVMRGIGVMARAIGLVGHVREELRNPIAREIKTRVEEETIANRDLTDKRG